MKYLFSKFILFLLFFLSCTLGWTQSKYSLTITTDKDMEIIYNPLHNDSFSVINEVENVKINLLSQGYISAYLDTVVSVDSSFLYSFVLGELYSWEQLSISPLFSFISSNSFQSVNTSVDIKQFNQEIEEVLSICQNKGYPFAQIFYDSVEILNDRIKAKLDINLNDFVIFDSVIVKGGMKTSLNYVTKQIGVKIGEPYNEMLVNEVNSKIANIPFVETIRSPEVYFTKGKATLVLYLKDKTASRFDGIVGLNPDEITGKIGITGDLKVDLMNAFKKGENIVLNWEKAKFESQTYLAQFSYPFLFKTNIGLVTGVNYYRQDSTFANLEADFGFSIFLDENQSAGVSAQFIESNSLLSSSAGSSGVPSTNTINTIYYGVNYVYNSLDYKLNPRRGIEVAASLKTGSKSIEKNANYTDELYENLEENTLQIKTDVTISYFIPLFKKSTVMLKVLSGNLFGDNIFLNELYQVGGLNTLRGFNEQSILVSNFYIGTAEFRYLFDRNSAVFAFLDYGFYENLSLDGFETDTPFGLGIGANFETKAGIFSLSYGLGKQMGNPILFKNGKIHFGFVSLF